MLPPGERRQRAARRSLLLEPPGDGLFQPLAGAFRLDADAPLCGAGLLLLYMLLRDGERENACSAQRANAASLLGTLLACEARSPAPSERHATRFLTGFPPASYALQKALGKCGAGQAAAFKPCFQELLSSGVDPDLPKVAATFVVTGRAARASAAGPSFGVRAVLLQRAAVTRAALRGALCALLDDPAGQRAVDMIIMIGVVLSGPRGQLVLNSLVAPAHADGGAPGAGSCGGRGGGGGGGRSDGDGGGGGGGGGEDEEDAASSSRLASLLHAVTPAPAVAAYARMLLAWRGGGEEACRSPFRTSIASLVPPLDAAAHDAARPAAERVACARALLVAVALSSPKGAVFPPRKATAADAAGGGGGRGGDRWACLSPADLVEVAQAGCAVRSSGGPTVDDSFQLAQTVGLHFTCGWPELLVTCNSQRLMDAIGNRGVFVCLMQEVARCCGAVRRDRNRAQQPRGGRRGGGGGARVHAGCGRGRRVAPRVRAIHA